MKRKLVSALVAALLTTATLSMTVFAYGDNYIVWDEESNTDLFIALHDYPGETIESFCQKYGYQLVARSDNPDALKKHKQETGARDSTYGVLDVDEDDLEPTSLTGRKSTSKKTTTKKTTTQTTTQTNTAAVDALAAQKVQQLYSQLIAQGMTSDKAMAQVNAQLSTLVAQAQQEIAAAGTSTASTAAEAVDQLYAQLIAQGMTSDKAMAQVNAQLPTILAKYSKQPAKISHKQSTCILFPWGGQNAGAFCMLQMQNIFTLICVLWYYTLITNQIYFFNKLEGGWNHWFMLLNNHQGSLKA